MILIVVIFKALEKLEPDTYHGRRVHAWIAIIQPSKTEDPNNSESTAFFIEPSTGFSFNSNDPNYLGIESVWSTSNYYVYAYNLCSFRSLRLYNFHTD